MRVLIDYRPALRNRSGVGESTHQLVRALLARGGAASDAKLDVTIFSSSWKDRLIVSPELEGVAAVDRRVPVKLLNFAWHRLGWPAIEDLTGRTFDVVHSSHPLLMPSRGAAQIVTIHDLYFLDHPERTRAEVRRDYGDLVRDHARRAARIIVPSTFTGGEVERRLGVPAERIAVCPHGAPEWAPRSQPPHEGYILFFGTLEPRKNVMGLLDAYERLIHTRTAAGIAIPDLVLAGAATDEARPCLDRSARAPLLGHVRHVGYVDPARRQELYAGARLLVLPSFDEGFGLPVLEAMTCGVPVVASDRGALPEVLGGAGPLVNPDDPADIAAGIARLLDSDPYAADCARTGLERARLFNWEHTAGLVLEAYGRAITTHRSDVAAVAS